MPTPINFKTLLTLSSFALLPAVAASTAYILTQSVLLALANCAAATLAVLAIVRYVLVSPHQSKLLTVKSIFVYGLASAVIVAGATNSLSWTIIRAVAKALLPSLDLPEALPDAWSSNIAAAGLIIATIITVAIVVMGRSPNSGAYRKASDISDKQIESIARSLTDHVDRLDEELRFFDFRSGTTDPQLEEITTLTSFAKALSPAAVVTQSKERDVIIIRGEPGSGKSVMLRSLARTLLSSIPSGGRIPLLLNLRDWRPPSDASIPQISISLATWVKEEFLSRIPTQPRQRLSEQFEQLYSEGAIILLFDSFDEISIVSEADHNDDTTQKVSSAIVSYIRSSGGCIGVILSREYKSPIVGWVDHSLFGVKPFNDRDVQRYLTENCRHSERLRAAIRDDRADLFAISRTPLLLALLVDYCNGHDGALPASEFDLFDSFVRRRIRSALAQLGLPSALEEEVHATSRFLAHQGQLQAGNGANSISLSDNQREALNVELRVLVAARLVKQTGTHYSFAHRRIQEFYLVLRMIDGESEPPIAELDRTGSNRDALALYAQICAPDEAEDLALSAYKKLRRNFQKYRRNGSHERYVRIIMCLRFLRQAFRNRPEIIARYKPRLSHRIAELWNSFDLLRQKHALEHISLAPDRMAANLVRHSLEQKSGWLRRTALAEARYLPSLRPWLGRRVASYASELDEIDLSIEYERKSILPPIMNAETIDRGAALLDIALRAALIGALIGGILYHAPIPSSGIFVAFFYMVLTLSAGRGGYHPFEFQLDMGLNRGLSGHIAFIVLVGTLINVIGVALGSKNYPWHSSGWIWSAGMMGLSIILFANNRIVRLRDLENQLGPVRILSSAFVSPSRGWTWQDLRRLISRYAVLILMIIAFVISHLHEAGSQGLLLLLACWLLWVAADVLKALGQWIREVVLERLEKPKVIRFQRHFSGQRSEIAEALFEVQTIGSRRAILRIADARSGGLSLLLRDPDNEWPGGERPSLNDPGLDSYLAILDEQWRGLS